MFSSCWSTMSTVDVAEVEAKILWPWPRHSGLGWCQNTGLNPEAEVKAKIPQPRFCKMFLALTLWHWLQHWDWTESKSFTSTPRQRSMQKYRPWPWHCLITFSSTSTFWPRLWWRPQFWPWPDAVLDPRLLKIIDSSYVFHRKCFS